MTNMKIHRGYDREELNKLAEDIRAKFELEPKMTVSEVLEYGLSKSIESLNDQARAEEWNEEQIREKVRGLSKEVNAVNDSRRIDRLFLLESEPFASAINSFMESQLVTGKKVGLDKETHAIRAVDDTKVYLHPYDVMQAICKNEIAQIINGAWIFADNVVKFRTKDDTAHISKDALGKEYAALRSRMGWDNYKGNTALTSQMTELLGWMLGSACPKLVKADVDFVFNSVWHTEDSANSAGTYKVRETAKLIDLMFRAAYTRHNKLAYKVVTPKEIGNPVGQSNNKDMAEAPAKPDQKPEAGQVSTDPKAPKAESKK